MTAVTLESEGVLRLLQLEGRRDTGLAHDLSAAILHGVNAGDGIEPDILAYVIFISDSHFGFQRCGSKSIAFTKTQLSQDSPC